MEHTSWEMFIAILPHLCLRGLLWTVQKNIFF